LLALRNSRASFSYEGHRVKSLALLQALYTIRSERLLMEEIDYSVLFRWFVGLGMDEPIWSPTTFSKNRDRLVQSDIAAAFFDAVVAQARAAGLLSDQHFTVDGTLLNAGTLTRHRILGGVTAKTSSFRSVCIAICEFATNRPERGSVVGGTLSRSKEIASRLATCYRSSRVDHRGTTQGVQAPEELHSAGAVRSRDTDGNYVRSIEMWEDEDGEPRM